MRATLGKKKKTGCMEKQREIYVIEGEEEAHVGYI